MRRTKTWENLRFFEVFGAMSPNMQIFTIGVQNRDLGLSIAVPGPKFRRATFLKNMEKVIFGSWWVGRPAGPGRSPPATKKMGPKNTKL